MKTEEDDENSRGLSNTRSSPLGDAKETGISSEQMSENSKMNDAVVTSSQSSDHKAQDAERSLDGLIDHHTDKFDELSGGPCQLKRELVGSEGSVSAKNIPLDAKHGLVSAEERPRSGGAILNAPVLPNQRKMVVCVGKSSSTSSTIMISKPSSTDDSKPVDAQNPNPITKQRVTPDSNLSNKKDRALSDVVKDEEKDDLPRNAEKERPKSSENSALKASHSSRVSHDSVPKRTLSDSKDNSSSKDKVSSAQNISAATGPGESAVSLHQQKSLHAQNKTHSSGLPQRGEKFNQANFQLSSKMNQNHGPSTHPPPSNSPATLSDEEV